jgi:hypothetical protein
MSRHTKANRKVMAVGAAFLVPPAFIVFQGLQNLAAMPMPVAFFAIAGLAALSVTLIFLGLQNLEAGDARDAMIQFTAAGVIMLSEFAAQWWFAITEGHALVTALVLSVLSVGGAFVIEAEIMRVWKANARRDGLLSLPRAQVPSEVAREFPIVGNIARRLAIRYPNATQSSILAEAFAEADRMTAEAPVQIRADVRDLRGSRPAIESGSPAEIEAPRTVSALVKEGIEEHGADADAIAAHVLRARPDAKPDTIRKTISRETAVRSA